MIVLRYQSTNENKDIRIFFKYLEGFESMESLSSENISINIRLVIFFYIAKNLESRNFDPRLRRIFFDPRSKKKYSIKYI